MSADMGSANYNRAMDEIKQFLVYNGYDKTLKSIEEEEARVATEKMKEKQENT